MPPGLDVSSFPDELDGTADYLVRSTDFEYKEGAVASFIASITQAGYAQQPDGSYFRKSLPKLEFRYTEVQVDETVHEIDPESIKNLALRRRWRPISMGRPRQRRA